MTTTVGKLRTVGLSVLLSFAWLVATVSTSTAQEWLPLYQSYARRFQDKQIRVIDHDAGDRTTSEAQAYAMFFALVADDRSRFDALLRWTEVNLASGDLTAHLPAWLWGRDKSNRWRVLDANPAADADVWMAYTLLEAGRAWNDPRYTSVGTALARRVAEEEVADVPGVGVVLLPAPKGFHPGNAYRLNASYMPLQLFTRLAQFLPDGPWQEVAEHIPAVVSASSPHGFVTDWIEFSPNKGFTPSQVGSYDAIRVYLWAGMLDPGAPGRDTVLRSVQGMADWLRSHALPPETAKLDGAVTVGRGSVGFSAALLPYLSAIGEKDLAEAQHARVRSDLDPKTGLYGKPGRYYDQNLALFGLGWIERRFWFDSRGALNTPWRHE